MYVLTTIEIMIFYDNGKRSKLFSRDAQGRRSEYVSVERAHTVNGVKGHVIKKEGDSDTHTNLPYYSNTSDIYFRKNSDGVCQGRLYIGNKQFLDFDWSHDHRNKADGRTFKKGTVHVQMWQENKDGSFSRISDSARMMNNSEMKKYGAIIKYYCPDVKLR